MARAAPPAGGGRLAATAQAPRVEDRRRPILVVDDDAGLRELFVAVLADAGFAVTEAATGEEALAAARDDPPELVLLDVHLPGISGYEVCRRLKDEHSDAIPIVFVSGERTESYDRVAGLLLGAQEYLVKPVAPDELVVRVRQLVGRAEIEFAGTPSLTARELEVLRLLTQGLGPDEIAQSLIISPKTVGTHLEHIFRKLGVRSRAQAVASAFRLGLMIRLWAISSGPSP